MNKKGRSLMHFLGLRREVGHAWSGGVEHLLPGLISGWVVAQDVTLHEVRLLVGPHLITRAEINQARPDVCETLGWQGKPGFALVLPAELPPLDWQPAPRLLALSADGSQQLELKLISNPRLTAGLLKALLQSELLGMEGHVDGLLQGALRGWAGRRGQGQPAQIWLQAAGQEPWPLSCDQRRDGLPAMGLPERSGFHLNPQALPPSWGGLEVWCSFDQQGQFRLPQEEKRMVLPSRAGSTSGGALLTEHSGPLPSAMAKPSSYKAMLEAAPEDLRQHWQALEAFRSYLDGVEQQLAQEQQQRLLASRNKKQAASRHRWWPRLLGGR
jgi:hypothetical protein